MNARDGVLLDPMKRDASGAVLLNSRGRPEFEPPFNDRPPELAGFPRTLGTWVNPAADNERYIYEAPQHIRDSLDRAKMLAGPFEPRAAAGWQATISRTDADGVQVLNTTTETIAVPDYTVPGNWLYGGKQIKIILWGRCSTVVTTPGTVIFATRWGGVAGTAIVTSKAQRPKVTVSTNSACQVEMLTTWRRTGTAGVAIGMGTCVMGNTIGDAAAAGEAVWPDAPAEVTSLDTSIAKALSATVKFSVATATTAWTTHMARIEDLT